MRIKEITTVELSCPLKKPMADARLFIPKREALLVLVHTDEGLTGIGEAASFGGPPITTKIIIERELRPHLLGEDPFRVEWLWEKMFERSRMHGRRGVVLSAMSGIDIALWDLIGKITKTPLYKLLGGYRDRIRAYASAGFYEEGKGPKELAQEMANYVKEGFRAVKMKVGRNPSEPMNPLHKMEESSFCNVSLEEDLERVKSVRETIGKDIQLMVDANNAWTPDTAIKIARELERYKIYWLEEPVFTDDIEGSAKVAAAIDTAVAGYETEQGRYGFRDLITKGAVDIVQPDVTWAGGITECRKIAAFAASYYLPCVPHTFSSAISLVASLHFIASLPNGFLLEFDRTYNPLREELIKEPIHIDKDGYVALPDRGGLGIELDEGIISKYRV